MSDSDSFRDFLSALGDGEERAANKMFNRFSLRLVALARSRMDSSLRVKVDEEDVAQSVMKSFFRRQTEKPFDLDNWDNLWALLAVMTVVKCNEKVRSFRRSCRDIRREVVPTDLDESPLDIGETREPTPDEAAALVELLTLLMQGLDGHEREILSLLLQGFRQSEIVRELQTSRRTVERVRKRLKEHILSLNRNLDA